MSNKRIFYAIRQAGFAPLGSRTYTALKGVQSAGMSTAFNLQQVFELGNLQVYQQIEEIPEVTLTLTKVFDGQESLYHRATHGATGNSLIERSNVRTSAAFSLFSDLQGAASGTPVSSVEMSGMYWEGLSISCDVEGNFQESLNLVGFNRTWQTGQPFAFSGAFTDTEIASGIGVQRRQHLIFDYTGGSPVLDVNGAASNTASGTILGPDIFGISSSGTNNRDANGDFGAHIQSISVNVGLSRTNVLEMGRRGVFTRFTNFPVEITTEITALSTGGDQVSATEAGILPGGTNLTNRTIKLSFAQGDIINLGTNNKLTNVTVNGGDAGNNDNESLSYSYITFNSFTWTSPFQS